MRIRSGKTLSSNVLTETLALKLTSEIEIMDQLIQDYKPNSVNENLLQKYTIADNLVKNCTIAQREWNNENIKITVPVYSARNAYTHQKANNETGVDTTDEIRFFLHSLSFFVQITKDEGIMFFKLSISKLNDLRLDAFRFVNVSSRCLPLNKTPLDMDWFKKSQIYSGRNVRYLRDSFRMSLLSYLKERDITFEVLQAIVTRSWRKENALFKSWLANTVKFLMSRSKEEPVSA
ncbi:Mam33 family protein [Schizosaccharomyces japonicus yFS275]|uniref:Mam33 family protein n=1 Tax=Schizosaccharomyces japonicus (strain yFS275 / FY16936) TaxID=402676 RepID=B6K3C0_SCHJY|nr:Mam33 family protein [Schizosaccharomyces japonicus yFS275]EEB07977.1 Mam33 family protein [Schizosaccharomyces japonicus yFS275]